MSTFDLLFRQGDAPQARAKYLSRLFGIFSEEVVQVWAADRRSPYENLGRPTLRRPGESRGSTLDFTLRERTTGKTFVAEMKCEIEYRNFRYFLLEAAEQLRHHNKPAFDSLLKVASGGTEVAATVARRQVRLDGAILIWGSVTEAGKRAVMQSFGFYDVLSVSRICEELTTWESAEYKHLLDSRRAWANELFDGLQRSGTESGVANLIGMSATENGAPPTNAA